MKLLPRALVLLGLLIPAVAGCGSGHPPPLSLTCTLKAAGPPAPISATVEIANQTADPLTAYIYGPALAKLRRISPVPHATQVVVVAGRRRTVFLGYAVPRIPPDTPVHLSLWFAAVSGPTPVLVSSTRTVHVDHMSDLDNPDCEIQKVH